MDTAYARLAATLDHLDTDAEADQKQEPRCVIPGCRYTAPTGLKCGYHTGADLRSRTAKPNYALRLDQHPT